MSQSQYRQILTDHFPDEIQLLVGPTTLIYQKQLFTHPKEGLKGLRYGENPGQEAALYRQVKGSLELGGQKYLGPEAATVSALGEPGLMSGGEKHPSMTNFTDLDAGLNLAKWLTKPAAIIIKHNNPSGVAIGGSLSSCFLRAYRADELSSFGGVVVFNRPLDLETAKLIGQFYVEVVAAPDFAEGVLDLLTQKPDLRVFKVPGMDKLAESGRSLLIKSLADGGLILHQSMVNRIRTSADFLPAKATRKGETIEALRTPTPEESEDLILAWAVLNAVSSNSVVVVKNETTVAIAGGQQSRLGVVQLAIDKAYHNYCQLRSQELHQSPYWRLARDADPALTRAIAQEAKNAKAGLIGASLASDGFFPFPDAVMEAMAHGISAFAHPGGSLQDFDSIKAVNDHSPPAAMVFTGQRAFKH